MAVAEVVAVVVQAAPEVAIVPQEVVAILIHQVDTRRSSPTVPLTTTTATLITT